MTPGIARYLSLVFLVLAAGCSPRESDYYAIRRAVVQEILGQGVTVDDLIIRLAPGELRENFGFMGETVFLIGDLREEEYWKVRDPSRSYLFLEDISLNEDKTTATIEIELYPGDGQYQHGEFIMEKLMSGWKVVMHRTLG